MEERCGIILRIRNADKCEEALNWQEEKKLKITGKAEERYIS